MPEVHGFFYHFTDIETGARIGRTELSSIDTALLLCGVLTAREHFRDARIKTLAQQIYERVDWPWMLNGGDTFAMDWRPGTGFRRIALEPLLRTDDHLFAGDGISNACHTAGVVE